jgi:hypothetical protein
MKFDLDQLVLGRPTPLESTEAEFHALKTSRSCVQHALAIEEKYSVTLRNYYEIEREVHRLAAEFLLLNGDPRHWLLDGLRDMNRVFMIYMTGLKTFLDHVPQHINAIYGPSSPEAQRFATKTSEEYDGSLGYLVVTKALRNHAQHQDFPVHNLVFGTRRYGDGQDMFFCNSVAATFNRNELLTNGEFNQLVRTTLGHLEEDVDVLPLVRQCMSSFGRLQVFVRELLQPRVVEADLHLESAYKRFQAHANLQKEVFGLHAVKRDEAGKELEAFPFSVRGIERRKRMEAQNATKLNLERQMIASRALPARLDNL